MNTSPMLLPTTSSSVTSTETFYCNSVVMLVSFPLGLGVTDRLLKWSPQPVTSCLCYWVRLELTYQWGTTKHLPSVGASQKHSNI
jgi:hypothetical protein